MFSPRAMMLEAAADIGYRHVVLDFEHGVFDANETDLAVGLGKALGMQIHAKVRGPDALAIQQAVDLGCDSVIIPHIRDLTHAAEITRTVKYPPLGTRSFSGTRPTRYMAGPEAQRSTGSGNIACYPMIETEAALTDIDAILALPTVDGVFVGPTDLALDRGRGCYRYGLEDRNDIRLIAEAARRAGKRWIMPAWSAAEQRDAIALNASILVVVDDYGCLLTGMQEAFRFRGS
jgi:4-hydroxy-2-oxoheptanedioate aldolase